MRKTLPLLVIGIVALPCSTAPADPRTSDTCATVLVCTGTSTNSDCTPIPVASADCINLIGGLSGLNKQISEVTVPTGSSCMLFQDFGCTSNDGINGEVELTAGTWQLAAVPGLNGTIDFDDLTSSLHCFSPEMGHGCLSHRLLDVRFPVSENGA
ncbi:hypothetical protein B0H15DRAFT_816492 [Mycena belliarum]|uniref:Secreted protein n=1 Tax=Mycena belliarum TaxID=1033014 RepID=A0AAD6UFL1_9AGAR|nr:hypothetical protein B0H15DRAFT_816492 [Mycena belliae]